MNAQARLVRCVERGRELFSALITQCNQQLRSGIRVGAFASAFTLLSMDACAQDWQQPQVPPGDYGQFRPSSATPYEMAPPNYVQQTGHLFHQREQANCPPVDPALEAQLFPKDHRLNDIVGPVNWGVHNIFSGSWMSLDYLYGRINHHGGRQLGEPIIDTVTNGIELVNIQEQFPILFADGVTTGAAVVPRSSSIGWKHLNGIRGRFGLPIDDHSWIEGGVWAFGEENDSLSIPSIPPTDPTLSNVFGQPPIQFITTTLTTDGQPGTRTIIYDDSFFSNYKVNVWSGEVNHVQDLHIPFDGWSLKSIVGYRHEEYSERLTFGGTFTNVSGVLTDGVTVLGPLDTPISNSIDSKVHNFRHAMQFGFRSEVKQNWLTVGVEPKVAFGIAQVRSRVEVQDVRNPGNLDIDDPDSTITTDRRIRFAPSADLNLYAKLDVTDWLKFKVGYSLIWLGRVGVADTGFTLNEISDPNDPTLPGTADVRVDPDTSHRTISALTIGGEILLP